MNEDLLQLEQQRDLAQAQLAELKDRLLALAISWQIASPYNDREDVMFNGGYDFARQVCAQAILDIVAQLEAGDAHTIQQ